MPTELPSTRRRQENAMGRRLAVTDSVTLASGLTDNGAAAGRGLLGHDLGRVNKTTPRLAQRESAQPASLRTWHAYRPWSLFCTPEMVSETGLSHDDDALACAPRYLSLCSGRLVALAALRVLAKSQSTRYFYGGEPAASGQEKRVERGHGLDWMVTSAGAPGSTAGSSTTVTGADARAPPGLAELDTTHV